MGEALYEALLADEPGAACRVYAPVGGHRDLLAYLVRRLLENGANSSFVSVAADPAVPVVGDSQAPAALDPRRQGCAPSAHSAAARSLRAGAPKFRRRRIRRPREPRCAAGRNAGGHSGRRPTPPPLIDGLASPAATPRRAVADRRRNHRAGHRSRRDDRRCRHDGGRQRLPGLGRDAGRGARRRARTRRRHAGARTGALPRCCSARAARRSTTRSPKCARRSTSAATTRPRRGGRLRLVRCRGRPARPTSSAHRGRGVFVCISPWNFPLAIFLGQVTAALAAGNAVVAKPAEQTPLIAAQGGAAAAPRGNSGDRAASRSGRRPRRRGADLRSARRRRCLHRLDRGRALDQPRAGRQGRPDRAADRRDRRHQRHDRRRDRAARAGDRRRGRVGVPLRRPALLGAAAPCACRRTSPNASSP